MITNSENCSTTNGTMSWILDDRNEGTKKTPGTQVTTDTPKATNEELFIFKTPSATSRKFPVQCSAKRRATSSLISVGGMVTPSSYSSSLLSNKNQSHIPSTTSSLSLSARTPRQNLATTPAASRAMESSYIVAIVEGRGLAKGEVGMAAIDLKGSELTLLQFSDTASYVKLLTKLNVLKPTEVLMPSTACENGQMADVFIQIKEKFPNITLTTVQRKYFNEATGLQYVKDLCVSEYKSVEIAVKSKYYCLATAAALLKYIEFIQNVMYAPNSLKIVFKASENTTLIDTSVAKHLELVQNSKDPRSRHSLFGIMNYTKTAAGSRLLRANILQPPHDLETINSRFDCIEELLGKEDMFLNLQSVLSKFLDVEHLISLCIQVPRKDDKKSAETRITEIIQLKHVLELVQPLKQSVSAGEHSLFRMYAESLEDERFQLLLEIIFSVINEETVCQKGTLNMRTQKVFLIKDGVKGLLDVVRRVYTECIDDINELTKQLSNQFDFMIKTAYNTTRGFFIQIDADIPIETLPDQFIKTVKSKSSISCTTEDLIKLNGRVNEALNEIYTLTNLVISEMMVNIREQIGCLHKLAECVSVLDMIVSLAHACTISNYVRPEFTDTLGIKQGRHPILEKILPAGEVIPNDAYASNSSNFIIITGPNMSGKSTYLRQIVLLQIMAQVGSFVPAEYASFRAADQIFARVGTDDDIETNSSTFTLEMKEINHIIRNVQKRSLVIVDELCRGTSVDEGIGLSYSLCEHLLQKKVFTFFATHFIELCRLEHNYPNVQVFHMEVQTDYADVPTLHFSHSLAKGKTMQENYGVRLAEMSSLPSSLINAAKEVLQVIKDKERSMLHPISTESRKHNAIFRLGTRLLQVSKHSRLDQSALRAYLQGLKQQYLQDI